MPGETPDERPRESVADIIARLIAFTAIGAFVTFANVYVFLGRPKRGLWDLCHVFGIVFVLLGVGLTYIHDIRELRRRKYALLLSKRRMILISGGVIALLVGAAALVPLTVRTRVTLTCSLCRAERTDHRFLGYSWSNFRDTEFTTWHRVNRPAHDHLWGRLTCTRGFSIFGGTTFFGCGPSHPICDIPSDSLREFAERADTNTLAAFFVGITSTNYQAQTAAVQMAWDRILERE